MPALESLDSFSRLPANILCDQRCIERSGGHLRRPPDARADTRQRTGEQQRAPSVGS